MANDPLFSLHFRDRALLSVAREKAAEEADLTTYESEIVALTLI
jgi:hypothetical protein